MNIFKSLFTKLDDSSNDKLGVYPAGVHVNAMPERRYLKTSRAMTMIAAGLWCLTVILGLIIYMLVPQLRPDPELLAINRRFYRLDPVLPSTAITPAQLLLREEYIKQYIIMRHTILADIDEMKVRWGEESTLRWMSEKEVYTKFFANEYKTNMEKMLAGYTAEVRVRFVEALTLQRWLAEFEIIEHEPDKEMPVVRRYRVLMGVILATIPDAYYKTRENHIKNPLNFIVTEYNLSSRALTKDDKNAKFVD